MRSRRRAFTIVELLVVITIIVILIGLLLPALSAAYRTAMEYECQNNLHHLAVVVAAYCTDNDGYFPRATGAGATPSANDWLYLNDSPTKENVYKGVLVYQKRVGSKMAQPSTGTYVHVGETDLYYCPIDVENSLTPKAGQVGIGLNPPKRLTSYVINGSITYGNTGNERRVRRFSEFDPNDFLFIEESEDSNFDQAYMTPTNSANYTITKRHHGGGYAACMDGHVDWWSQDDFKTAEDYYSGNSEWYKSVPLIGDSDSESVKEAKRMAARWNPG